MLKILITQFETIFCLTDNFLTADEENEKIAGYTNHVYSFVNHSNAWHFGILCNLFYSWLELLIGQDDRKSIPLVQERRKKIK